MATFGITRSYNEVDLIEWAIRRMLRQVDHIIIGDNSNDGSEEILRDLAREYPADITLLWDDAPSVAQRDVMMDYAGRAQAAGGEWGVFFDIDEAWLGQDGNIASTLRDAPDSILLAPARNLNHNTTDADDPADLDPMHRMGWRNAEMLPLYKMAARLRDDLWIGHGNHTAGFWNEPMPGAANGILEARHFPYRSPEQFIKRVQGAWPQLRDSGLPESHGAHMWAYGRHLDEFGPEGLARWFENGMRMRDPASNPDLVHDPLPPLTNPDDEDE